MDQLFLLGFSVEEQKEISKPYGVEHLSLATEKPIYPLKAFIDGTSLYRCFCNLICSLSPNPAYNLIFLIDTGIFYLRLIYFYY
jgi:hypothetical protein